MAKSYPLTDAEVGIADAPIMPEIDATEALTETLMIDNEYAVASTAGTRANYAASNKAQLVTGTTSWAFNNAPYSTTQTSFPISVDIPNAKKAVKKSLNRKPTHMVLNYGAAVTLSQNWEYLKDLVYTSDEGVSASGLRKVVAGLQVVPGDALYETNAEGVADTTGYIWVDDQGQDCAIIYYRKPGGRRV